MTVPRSKQVNADVTRWYHCISRCVRQASLLAEGEVGDDRKAWIERRLKYLSEIFAISVGGFSVLDNHFHVLTRLEPALAEAWDANELVERWFKLFPPRNIRRTPLNQDKLRELKENRAKDAKWVERTRSRLSSLGWFMKCLKEPLARMVNKIEKRTGAFWEGRYKSIAVLDAQALLVICAYIDLNPVAAGIAPTPEASAHTSLKARVEHVSSFGRVDELKTARKGSLAASRSAIGLEDGLWLIPIEDRRRMDSAREGIMEQFTLGNYLMLVEYTGRMLREGKASISSELSDIFDRLGNSARFWQTRVQKLVRGRLLGRFFASKPEVLRATAKQIGAQRLANLFAKTVA